ncbi:MAG: sulfite exporter TauE/SafE family protein [Methanoregulaceae archaeon]|nr:sulfite exporter TauE/SafE family protein [Methanoregulaceae archaeon]
METGFYFIVLLAAGAVSGFSSGLLGLGGCYLNVPVQYWVLTSTGFDPTISTRIAFGTSLAIALLISMINTIEHHKRNEVFWEAAIPIGIAGIAGSLIGGTVAALLPGGILRTLFAVVLLVAAVRMLIPMKECRTATNTQGKAVFVATGLFLGIVSGLVGIAGGIIIVPILVCLLRFPMHQAAGTSSACIIFTSAGGVVAYLLNGMMVSDLPPLSIGYINLLQWSAIAFTTIPFTLAGIHYAYRLPARKLSVVFAFLLIAISVYMFGALP